MAKPKLVDLKIVSSPHNGTKPYRRRDPIVGDMIGGQVLFMRTCLRRKRVIAPLGRRWGKTTARPFLFALEAALTKGQYTAGYVGPNHTKAWEAFCFTRDQLGPAVVKAAVGDPETQNRYLDLYPIVPSPTDDKTQWAWMYRDPDIAPRMAGIGKNTGSRIYFWSGQMPHAQSIQGFPFRFHRISLDESQQLHPTITRIVNPMLLDSGGYLDCTGIPDIDAIGNTWFSDYYERGNEPERAHRWASLNFPTYDNPNLDKEAVAEIRDDILTNDDYDQYIMGSFISGTGAVFTNLDAVFVLTPVAHREHPSQTDGPAWLRSLFTRLRSDVMKWWVYEGDPRPNEHYALTVDFAGRTRTRDATIIDVFNLTRNEQALCLSIRDMISPDQLAWIEGVKDHYGANEVHCDDTPEGSALTAYLRERYRTGVIGHKFSASNKPQYVKRGQFLFEMAEVKMIDCAYQRKEFQQYKRIAGESKDGKDQPVSYSHPPGRNDDTVSAFLQIAPYMAHGTRPATIPDPITLPMVDADHKTTTLERWSEGLPTPFAGPPPADEITWGSVVLPPRYNR